MVTIFSTAKPFLGHSGVIQKNALKSWTLLHPEVQVILFGDEEGAAEVAQELNICHEPHVERSPSGMKYLDYMFRRTQEVAKHDLLCYLNCDILLFSDYWRTVERVAATHQRFLMIGRRWDTDITKLLDFERPNWEEQVRKFALAKGVQQDPAMVDYFTFRRGLYPEVPRLVVGRLWWDHWLVWKARKNGATLLDASNVVIAVHQNHDYGYHEKGYRGIGQDPETVLNYDLAGGLWHLYSIVDSTHVLTEKDERRNWKRFWAPYGRYLTPTWFTLLDWTRPIRHLLGIRKRVRPVVRAEDAVLPVVDSVPPVDQKC